MAKFLANENVPAEAIEAARQAGCDVAAVADAAPGADDDAVLAMSIAQGRVLVTFDKDFGEMAFRQGKTSTYGVVFLRPRLRSPGYVSHFMVAVLQQSIDWNGHFCVAQGKLRVLELPP